MARQIVVSGGAGFWCGDDGDALDRFALSLTGKHRPKVCYLATAAGDSSDFIEGFYANIGPLAEVTHLPLFLPPFRDPAETLLAQDLIYVRHQPDQRWQHARQRRQHFQHALRGGGYTESMRYSSVRSNPARFSSEGAPAGPVARGVGTFHLCTRIRRRSRVRLVGGRWSGGRLGRRTGTTSATAPIVAASGE